MKLTADYIEYPDYIEEQQIVDCSNIDTSNKFSAAKIIFSVVVSAAVAFSAFAFLFKTESVAKDNIYSLEEKSHILGNANKYKQYNNDINKYALSQVDSAQLANIKTSKELYLGDTRKYESKVQAGKVIGKDSQTDEKIVFLTFDDGPSSNTIKILEILDKYNIKATFFVTAQYPDYLYLIKEAYDKGHTIGLHTYSHEYETVYSNDSAYYDDLHEIGKIVKEQIGYVPAYIRFPGGSSNTISRRYSENIMSRLSESVLRKGYQYYDWNGETGDGGTVTREEAYNNAISADYNSNIVLLAHDTPAKDTTVEALEEIIEYYLSKGYSFSGLDRNSFIAHQPVNN